MATQDNNSLEAKINNSTGGIRVGSNALVADVGLNSLVSASNPIYVDSSSKVAVGDLPFPLVLAAGSTNTGFAVASIKGSATGSANELMHLTLVAGANATAVIAGYYRVTVTDAAGVITSGDYYAPFYTLG
jgi:hypothetical protein